MMTCNTTDIIVRQNNGTYQTNSIGGVKASCTCGERQAAERMGQKLYGQSFLRAERLKNLSSDDHNVSHWRLLAEPVRAWAWQSGLIEFGRKMPEGALSFATGIDTKLREVVGVLARHGQGQDEGRLLVPGVPEAAGETGQIDALIAWVEWCAKGNGNPVRCGVVFTNRQDGRP